MRRVVYTHSTALAFWERRAALGQPCNLEPIGVTPNTIAVPTVGEALGLCPLDAPATIHVLLPSCSKRRNRPGLLYHYCGVKIPKGGFCALTDQVAIAAPSMVFLQLAKELSFCEIVALGCYLCASFVRVATDFDQRGFSACDPRADLRSLAKYMDKMGSFPHAKRCRRALQYVCEGAASPRELAVSMLLTMPTSQGGYGFPRAILNAPIELSDSGKLNIGKQHLCVDMLWPAAKVVIEYDSDAWHSGIERINYDSKRRNQLKAMGFEVITITNSEVKSVQSMDRIAKALARCMGRRLRIRNSQWLQKNRSLRDLLTI